LRRLSTVLAARLTPRNAALLVLAVAVATVAGAWTFEAWGYSPCELCLEGRLPHYLAMPVALATALGAQTCRARLARWGLAALALVFLAGAALSLYHSGVELKWLPGPTDCAGAMRSAQSTEDFFRQLQSAKVVRCDEPALWVLGLTLANWNALISLGLAGVAAAALRRAS